MTMVDSSLTLDEFAAKIDWEGGVYEAMFGYGLKIDDLQDAEQYPELVTAWHVALSAPLPVNINALEVELERALIGVM